MDNAFVNIMIMCTPNYNKAKYQGAVKRPISVVEQFVVLYHSIQKNWTFPNRITLLHTKEFNDHDLNMLTKLDIDMVHTKPDIELVSWTCRCQCYSIDTKIKGTHRLVMDCDMIALKNPEFDWDADFQAAYGGGIFFSRHVVDFICDKYNLKKPTQFIQGKKLCQDYYQKKGTKFFPYFNNGCVFIKEEFSAKLAELWMPTLELRHKSGWKGCKSPPNNREHWGGQIGIGLALYTLTDNWEPLPYGCNYLAKIITLEKFGKENVSLYHYCGSGAFKLVKQHFPEYLEVLNDL